MGMMGERGEVVCDGQAAEEAARKMLEEQEATAERERVKGRDG